ncbi:MAG TPA: acyl-CoA dehydrogenase family protein, partial [Methylomirabilota bacterium]|nr:acyl-CoA dehydrogenase family protein [Methylomirabilota bacterium]
MPAAVHPLLEDVRRFVDAEVIPAASALEHADAYPHALVARMRALGLFGALVPRAWGGLGLDVTTYARVIAELCRGWMSLAGVINSHTMAALIVLHHGTEAQRARLLPRFASGAARGGLCLTEPHAGSDVQAIRTVARRRGEDYLLNGTKMFVTNGREGNTFALLAVTDSAAAPRHRGMSCFIVEKGDEPEARGLTVVKSISKLGYKGVDTAELLFEDFAVPGASLVGGVEGRGFKHVMSGLETGRINIAARAVGVGQAAWDAARADGRRREPPPPVLADMAARLETARLITVWAAGMKDRAERCDLEAGMAKLHASETAQRLAEDALRVGGEAAALASSVVERLYRDTPLMIIGEGTNEIQRTLIARQLLERHGERLGALTGRDAESEERRQIVLAVRQFVEKAVVPVAWEGERAARYPEDLVRDLAHLGALGALAPPALGGLGLDLRTYAMLVEELARGWTAVAAIVAGHATVTWAITQHGVRHLREHWLPPMTRGEILGAVALDGDVTARAEGGTVILHGRTALVDAAPRAGVHLVRARLGGGRSVLAVVPRGTPGASVGAVQPTLGARGLEVAPVDFDGARVSASAVLEAGALRAHPTGDASVSALGLARLGLAATAVGLAQAAFEAALRYSQQRSAFGQAICHHQAIQLKLADMATAITAARLL